MVDFVGQERLRAVRPHHSAPLRQPLWGPQENEAYSLLPLESYGGKKKKNYLLDGGKKI